MWWSSISIALCFLYLSPGAGRLNLRGWKEELVYGRQSLVRVFYKHTETFAIILHLHNVKCYVHYIYKQKNALGLQGKL